MTMHNHDRGVDAVALYAAAHVAAAPAPAAGDTQVIHLGLSPTAARVVRRALDELSQPPEGLVISALVIRELDDQLKAAA